jgi:23S rRNA G2069 N7-methylase RlmK/C1962 C5-methylase RlmI
MKRRIEVDHCSFQRSHDLRFLITDIIKYAENKLRTGFGVKSKLSVYALPDKLKAVLDDYFAKVMPSRRAVTVEIARPEYEALYDLPETELSFEHAAEIEQASWTVTKQLVEAFENATNEMPEMIEKTAETVGPTSFDEQTPQIDEIHPNGETLMPYREFLVAAIQENATAQRQFARNRGLLIDAVADEINGIAVDVFGDIILEESGNGYAVIEDYLEDVKRIL